MKYFFAKKPPLFVFHPLFWGEKVGVKT